MIRDAKGLARSQAAPHAQQHVITAAGHLAPSPTLDILWRAAVHDAGHVVVAHLLGLPPAERATITLAGGFIDIPSTPIETRSSALNRVAALLGGRAAEEFLLSESSNGAGLGKGSDLDMAIQLMGRMLFEWGLGDQLIYAAPPPCPPVRPTRLSLCFKQRTSEPPRSSKCSALSSSNWQRLC